MSTTLRAICPQCLQVKGVLQEQITKAAQVEVYRCLDCQYVWSIDKSKHPHLFPPTIVRRH